MFFNPVNIVLSTKLMLSICLVKQFKRTKRIINLLYVISFRRKFRGKIITTAKHNRNKAARLFSHSLPSVLDEDVSDSKDAFMGV